MAPFFETHSQAWVFLDMVYLGLGLGIVYDVLGMIRRAGRKFWTVLMDLLFFLLAGAALTLALVITGQNALRLYAFLGLACGGILYLLGLRRLIIGIFAFFQKRIVLPAKEAARKSRERRAQRKSAKEEGKAKQVKNT